MDRMQPAERHDLPLAIALAQRAGRLPLLIAGGGKAVHQPERRRAIAAVLDEGEPFAVGDEVARQPDGTDEGAVHRLLIVEMEAVVAVADRMDAFAEREPRLAAARCGRKAPGRIVGG